MGFLSFRNRSFTQPLGCLFLLRSPNMWCRMQGSVLSLTALSHRHAEAPKIARIFVRIRRPLTCLEIPVTSMPNWQPDSALKMETNQIRPNSEFSCGFEGLLEVQWPEFFVCTNEPAQTSKHTLYPKHNSCIVSAVLLTTSMPEALNSWFCLANTTGCIGPG